MIRSDVFVLVDNPCDELAIRDRTSSQSNPVRTRRHTECRGACFNGASHVPSTKLASDVFSPPESLGFKGSEPSTSPLNNSH
ncbi:hypothetical protein Pla52n_55760 [Stieleria varia]|uniref:Uncharacterized protein n=1 Tax=Stieleria varia TaxID=2528005 RepID=A0A5C6A3B9_9BACT|nr:hypothetical protein Pla52n_55760 [Stieleria varia]